MRVIGLGTTAQVGKDTTALYLEGKYPVDGEGTYKVKRVAFADKLKEMASSVFGLSHAQCYGSNLEKETIDPRYGKSPRQILQELGDKLREIHPDIWIDTVFFSTIPKLRTQGYDTFIISDVRYPNEAEKIRRAGGAVVKILRPGSGTAVGANHPSETSMNDYTDFNYCIHNDSTLPVLYERVDSMMEELYGRTQRGDHY